MQPRGVRLPARHITALINLEPVALIDLSISGAQLEIDRELPIGTNVKVVLSYASEALSLEATIVWCKPSNQSAICLMGVKFLSPTPEQTKTIIRLGSRSVVRPGRS